MVKFCLLFVCLSFAFASKGQDANDQAFWDKFDNARLYIAKHNAGRSIQTLEELYALDTLNPNVNYLLGVALTIVGKEAERAAQLFEIAQQHFDKLWDNPGVGPPEHLYYYKILAYCRVGNCHKAKENLEKLEAIFEQNEDFLIEDEYYLIDGRKWAGLCKEPDSILPPITQRLVKHDLRVKTEPHRFSTASNLYGVQVAALLEPQMTRKLDGLKNVEVYVDMHGVYRYVIGSFTFRSQAEKMLALVKQQGYLDAFIVNITDYDRFPLEVVALDSKSPKAQIRGEVDYRIQLAAFKESLPNESARLYLMIDSISSIEIDEMSVLTVGKFKSYGNAIIRRDEIRRMGFRDAFIIALNEGRKVPINDARYYLRKMHE